MTHVSIVYSRLREVLKSLRAPMQVEELSKDSDSSIAELGRTLREIAYHIQARLR